MNLMKVDLDDNTIKTISEIYRNVIQKYINCLDSHLDCCVFEKKIIV